MARKSSEECATPLISTKFEPFLHNLPSLKIREKLHTIKYMYLRKKISILDEKVQGKYTLTVYKA